MLTRWNRCGSLIALLCFVAPACERPATKPVAMPGGAEREVVHPTRDLLLSSRTRVPVRKIAMSARADASLRGLTVFDSTTALGTLDQGADSALTELVFGELVDASFDAQGNLLLIDRAYRVVRVFSAAGQPMQIVGRQGTGPGEFETPESIVWLGADELGVFDAKRSRVEHFRRSATGYTASERTALTAIPRAEGVCATEGRRYVKGVRLRAAGADVSPADVRRIDLASASVAEGFVHELDQDGAILRSFSTPYARYDDPLLAINFNEEGGLACRGSDVWVGYGFLGEVHASGEDGKLKWIARITDFEHPGYLYRWSTKGEKLPRSGSMNLDLQKGSYAYEWISRLNLIGKNVLAVTVTRRSIGAAAENFPVTLAHRTYLLNAQNGRQVGSIAQSHRILGGGNGAAVLYDDDPFPRVSVVRLEK